MSGTDSARWLQLDEFGFHHTLAALPGNTLVLFGQPGCSACHAWHQLLETWQPDGLQQLAYVDVQASMALAHAFEIFHLPTLLLFVNGQYHGQLHSPMQRHAINQVLQQLLAAPASEEP
ncbi:co-chaperone YbbN [Aquitalea sp. LB_tupeE]|uniref:thioredoxin family protein n=1 Tax=Aquitalea sp. LB_tupeE TaxID=2748078 RepID=UPI0015BBB41A|nr:thioredoxin family protein [Aquitalea sp. LB_tupeE]NWK78978.1 thioredoxin family protein [Aquitalea sp. LB_tupeE]